MNILIIDDHILFAEGLKCLLESLDHESNTQYAHDAESALQHIFEHGTPDLMLLDIDLPEINGTSLLEKLHQLDIWSPVLMISANNVSSSTGIALANGAAGFILKSSDSSVLLDAIKTVMGGDIYMPCSSYSQHRNGQITVTNRQQEILYLLSQGMLNKQIAYELSISANTVKAHLSEIFRILKVKNRTAAVHNAYDKGLL
jgi:DNA-binding NarL/FixJ family response regulator